MKGSNWTRTSHNGLNNGGRLLQSLHSKYLMEIATSFLRIFFLILLTHRELELNEDNQFLFYIQTLFFSSEPPPKPPPNLLRNLLRTSSETSSNAVWRMKIAYLQIAWAAVVHLNSRAGSTFPVPICTVSHGHWVNKADN